jgi:hypothetical protein
MPSSGMLRSVALVLTGVSEEHITFIIKVRIGELGTMLAVISNRSTVRTNAIVFLRRVRPLLLTVALTFYFFVACVGC